VLPLPFDRAFLLSSVAPKLQQMGSQSVANRILSMPNDLVKEQAKRLAREWTPFNLRANKKILDAWGDLSQPPVLVRKIHAEIAKADPARGQRFYREFLRPFD
jgi:hypothetical protein